jgi:hypothetical protein
VRNGAAAAWPPLRLTAEGLANMPALRKIGDGGTVNRRRHAARIVVVFYLREFGQWQANGESPKLSRRVFKG